MQVLASPSSNFINSGPDIRGIKMTNDWNISLNIDLTKDLWKSLSAFPFPQNHAINVASYM